MKDHGSHRRRWTLDAMLVTLSLVLSLIESWIPLRLILPVPGIKLGLANIVTLVALYRLSFLDALIILCLRLAIMTGITGITAFFFSLAGGLLALVTMWFLARVQGKWLSLIGVSMGGATAHNMGQVAMASLLLGEPLFLTTYLPPLLLAGLVTGFLTGLAAGPVIRNLDPFPGLDRQDGPQSHS